MVARDTLRTAGGDVFNVPRSTPIGDAALPVGDVDGAFWDTSVSTVGAPLSSPDETKLGNVVPTPTLWFENR